MRIFVSEDGKTVVRLVIPTPLLLNRVTAGVGAGYLAKKRNRQCAPRADRLPQGAQAACVKLSEQITLPQITARDAKRLFSMIYRLKRAYPEWVLVDVQTSGGDVVQIKL